MLGNLYGITLLNALVLDNIKGFNFDTQVVSAFDSINIEDNKVVVDEIRLELQYLKDTFAKFIEKNKGSIKDSNNNASSLLNSRLAGLSKTNPEDTVTGATQMVEGCGVKGKLTKEVLTKMLLNKSKILNLDLDRPTISIDIYKLCNRPLSFFKDSHVSAINVVVNSCIEHSASKGEEAILELVNTSKESIKALESLTDSHSDTNIGIYNYVLDTELLSSIFDINVTEELFVETIVELEGLGFYGFNDISEELIGYIRGRIVPATQNREFDSIVTGRPYKWFYRTIEELEDSLNGIGTIPEYKKAEELLDSFDLEGLTN